MIDILHKYILWHDFLNEWMPKAILTKKIVKKKLVK